MYIAFSRAGLAIYVIGIGPPLPYLPKNATSKMAADLEDLSGDFHVADRMEVLLAKLKPKVLASSLGVAADSIAGEIGI